MAAVRVVMEYKSPQGRQICEVHSENTGYERTNRWTELEFPESLSRTRSGFPWHDVTRERHCLLDVNVMLSPLDDWDE